VNAHAVNFGMSSPADAASLQVPQELGDFLEFVRTENVRSYLEIGCRYGGTFGAVMRMLPKGSVGIAVDFPGGRFGDPNSPLHLLGTLMRLRDEGYAVDAVFGPSGAPEVFQRVFEQFGRTSLDLVLIDGDHAYHAVKRDFEMYAPLGHIVALHDIAAPDGFINRAGLQIDVGTYWRNDLLKRRFPRYCEIKTPGSEMGIGIIWRSV
jgi:Methyltransferase domain